MENFTSLSVVIPIYNVEKYLRKHLDSLVNQTFKNIEIICINDGSSDNSLEILKEYAQKDNRIKILSQENHGVWHARKNGLEKITSKYFTFADPDDWLELDCYEKALNCFNINEDIDLVCYRSNTYKLEDNGVYTKFRSAWYNYKQQGLYNALDKEVLLKTPRVLWNKIYKTEIIRKNNLTTENLFLDDACFFYKYCLFSKKIYYADFLGYNYLAIKTNSIANYARKNNIEIFVDADFKMLISIFELCQKIGKIQDFHILEDVSISRSQPIKELEINQVNNIKKYVKQYLKYMKHRVETKFTKLLKRDIKQALSRVAYPDFVFGNSILGLMIYSSPAKTLVLYLFNQKRIFELIKNNKSILFLDFDGVLCDSVKEAYILSRYAYYGYDINKPIEKEVYEKFVQNRYLISNSFQYYYLMQILEEHFEFDTSDIASRFNKLNKNGKTPQAEDFNKRFLDKRKDLIENDYDFWNSLESPTHFLNQLKDTFRNSENCAFAILSTKNKEAIIRKLNLWKIKFNPKLIFDKKYLENKTKGKFIQDYMNSHSEYKEAVLIDDNEDNIASCANIENIKAYLTSWGYVNNPQNGTSEEEILKMIKEYIAA